MYYLQSRYYDPAIGRFVNADSCTITGQGIIGNNKFAYCGNNPTTRNDTEGYFWETALDVVSLGASIAEVAVNPADPWAWVGLAGDLLDLIPFVTGLGETTRAIEMTVSLADGASDVVETARKSYNALKKLDGSSVFTKATGSYEIIYKSGNKYIGKGGFSRAITSAKKHADDYDDIVDSISWRSSVNSTHAFIDEYVRQKTQKFGEESAKLYNKIWSPGRRKVGKLLGLLE